MPHGASLHRSFSLQRRDPPPDDLLIEVQY
jgi:hypothetical protein